MSTAVVAAERRACQFDLRCALFLELLHSMLLIVEHGRCKGELAEHANWPHLCHRCALLSSLRPLNLRAKSGICSRN